MIYDTFMFCHELDMLEIRLNILDPIVDKFVIVESPVSHTRLSKPLYFLDNIERFEKWLPKIIYRSAKVDSHKNPWFNEFTYREILLSMVPQSSNDDTILHGDLDEIPSPIEVEKVIKNLNKPTVFVSNYYMFCADLIARNNSPDTIVMKRSWIKRPMYEYRQHRSNSEVKYFSEIHGCGWHYSYCQTLSDIVTKLKFFAHSAEISESVKNENHLKECIKQKKGFDLTQSPCLKYTPCNVSNTPKFLLENQTRYPYLFSSYYE